MRRVTLLAGLGLVSCEGSTGIVQRCTREAMSTAVHCRLEAVSLERNQVARIDASTSTRKVQVVGTFTVKEGLVDVVLFGCERGGRVHVSPGEPGRIDCEVELDRASFSFTVDTFAMKTPVRGFAGEFDAR